jgi:selenide,water dikinase
VGDCAALEHAPWVPKAGVYAVRQGPVLEHNLRARLAGARLRAYRPQRDFLALLNLGRREALGGRSGLVAAGPWVWHLKDWIDRRFMRRFQVLDPDGAPAPHFPSPEAMGMQEMACGGCAAKVGALPLARALARLEPAPPDASVRLGLARPDDAAALTLPRGDLLLASVDGFRAFADDPWLVGRVAAVNAASDVFAKGGRPRHALALVGVPGEDAARAEELLVEVLSGVRAALDPLGVSLVGGHSTSGKSLFVGLAITGSAEGDLLPLDGLRVGERLILSKPLGTGVVLAADMRGLARGAWVRAAYAAMLRPNEAAAAVARAAGARACTDVSGFGLAGHLGEMLRASGCAATLRLERLPALPGALALLGRGVRSSYHEQNTGSRRGISADPAVAHRPAGELLFDPQTSGGLLFGVTPEREQETLAALHRAGDAEAAAIGEVTAPGPEGALLRLESGPSQAP